MLPLAVAACATLPPGRATGSTAALGEVAIVGTVRVQPLRIIEDSRCPADVQCVWAGRLRLLGRLSRDGSDVAVDRELTLGEPVPVFGGQLTLVAAEPEKRAAASDVAAYRFTFAFERGL